jgi:hypothetical protein
MLEVPAARFEDSADERGRRGIVRRVGAFVTGHGVEAGVCDRIAETLATALDTAGRHALAQRDARFALTADVMPRDVQVILRLSRGGSGPEEDRVGGFELWISFPRD